MKKMTIGDFIKQIREKNGGADHWSRLAVATRAGMADSYLFQLESNKNTKPSPEILRKLAPALKISYEELMQAAGYLPVPKELPKTIAIPVYGECPAGHFNFAFEEIVDTVTLNSDIVKDKNSFALKVKGDCLKDIGIFDKDIVIISPHSEIKNGDVVIARIGDECTMKRFYKANNQVTLIPCNHHYDPIIVNPKEKTVEIIGKVIRALRMEIKF